MEDFTGPGVKQLHGKVTRFLGSRPKRLAEAQSGAAHSVLFTRKTSHGDGAEKKLV